MPKPSRSQRMTPRAHPATPAYVRPKLSKLLRAHAEWWLDRSLDNPEDVTAPSHMFKLSLAPEYDQGLLSCALDPRYPPLEVQSWLCLFEASLQRLEGN